MLTKSPNRIKHTFNDKKSRLLSFIQRHNSISPNSTHKSVFSLDLKSSRLSKKSSKLISQNQYSNLLRSASKGEISSDIKPDDQDLSVFLSELKEKLEKVEAASIMIEN